MIVLISIKNSPALRYVVSLPSKVLIKEVRDLVFNNRHSEAVFTALSRGKLEKEISEDEFQRTKADLILSEDSVRWDLTK